MQKFKLKLKIKKLICHSERERGYVALASVLVIAAVVLVISISVSLLSVSEGQMSLAGKKNEESVDFVEACIEDVLLRLNEGDAIPTQISLPEGTCDVTIDSQSGDDWTFSVSGNIDNYTKNIQISCTRSTIIDVTSWQEIE